MRIAKAMRFFYAAASLLSERKVSFDYVGSVAVRKETLKLGGASLYGRCRFFISLISKIEIKNCAACEARRLFLFGSANAEFFIW